MNPSNYINRELSWLQFNYRVLEEAMCKSNPLLERLKFLAITAANLDEFFMVRVGSLTVLADSSSQKTDIAGFTADEQLARIREQTLEFIRSQSECFADLEKELREQDIIRCSPDDLTSNQRVHLEEFFSNEVLSAVAPIAIDSAGEFPMLSGTRQCICVRLENDPASQLKPNVQDEKVDSSDEPEITDRYVIIPLGRSLRPLVTLPSDEGYRYMLLYNVVGMFLSKIFGNQKVIEWAAFRVTRNADILLDEDAASDLLSGMEQMLAERAVMDCVRLEIKSLASPEMRSFLQTAIGASDHQVYPIDCPVDLSFCFALAGIKGYQSLKDTPWTAQSSPDFHIDQDPFETIAEADRLLYHPYQSYEPVVDFIRTAAADPSVIAIKQTLYRTSRDSQIAEALMTAAENGKHVTVIVELKARFDEARNIQWAKQLEHAGIDVIYGVRGLKTHSKVCIVVRREPDGIKRYLHFGTGNYNESTAKLYSDVSYFTCDEELGMDAVHFFNAITGLSVPQPFERLVAAPINLRETFLELIRIESENAVAGNAATITAKINSLADKEIIDSLYAASQNGVKIRLNVRGICCLRPGIPGISENIQVISVVDRMLEHARIFHFRHGGNNRMFISSADWMGRNLDRRVELMVPVEDKACKSRLLQILNCYFEDNVKARVLQSDETYQPVKRGQGENPLRSQQQLFNEACEILATHTNPRTTVFKPHRGETG